jgi:hypothetical protein
VITGARVAQRAGSPHSASASHCYATARPRLCTGPERLDLAHPAAVGLQQPSVWARSRYGWPAPCKPVLSEVLTPSPHHSSPCRRPYERERTLRPKLDDRTTAASCEVAQLPHRPAATAIGSPPRRWREWLHRYAPAEVLAVVSSVAGYLVMEAATGSRRALIIEFGPAEAPDTARSVRRAWSRQRPHSDRHSASSSQSSRRHLRAHQTLRTTPDPTLTETRVDHA